METENRVPALPPSPVYFRAELTLGFLNHITLSLLFPVAVCLPAVGTANAARRSLITVSAAQRMSLLDGSKHGLEEEIQDEGLP